MSTFTEKLLSELSETPDNLEIQIKQLLQEQTVCIWGTGVAGQMIYQTGTAWGISFSCFIDGNQNSDAARSLMGLPVICPDAIPADAYILIAADVKYKIHERTETARAKGFFYLDPLLFSQYQKGTKAAVLEQYSEHAGTINRVYQTFQDDLSRQTFENVLKHRAIHNLHLLWDVFSPCQYFGNDVVPQAAGSFADCGAYNGDTLRAFLAQVEERDYRYYAFEPEAQNCQDLEQFVQEQQLSRVQVFRNGIWNKQETLCFSENTAQDNLAWTLSDAVSGTEHLIEADTLDHIMDGKALDYIKMDIEGAELRALHGAEQTVLRCHPTLEISAYHELNHLWLVPETILAFSPSYQLYCRHHSWNMADTVCYGIFRDRSYAGHL